MISKDKVQVFSNVPKPLKQRLKALSYVDHVLYSNSRVIAECIDAHLQVIEQRVQPFRVPSHETPGRKSQRRRPAA